MLVSDHQRRAPHNLGCVEKPASTTALHAKSVLSTNAAAGVAMWAKRKRTESMPQALRGGTGGCGCSDQEKLKEARCHSNGDVEESDESCRFALACFALHFARSCTALVCSFEHCFVLQSLSLHCLNCTDPQPTGLAMTASQVTSTRLNQFPHLNHFHCQTCSSWSSAVQGGAD